MIRARHAATLFAAVTHAAYALVDLRVNPLARHLLHDAARYDAWARALLDGRVFDTGAYAQAPLYPYFVAAVYAIAGARPAAVVALQVACGVAAVALTGRVAARHDETAGGWAAWLVALYGVLAFYETKLLPAALVVLLVAVFLDRAQAADDGARASGWLVPGAVLGALALASAGALLLLPAVAVWIAADRGRPWTDRGRRAASLAFAALLVVAPVALRNRAAGGGGVWIADNGGLTFWHGNNPSAVGVYTTPDGFTGSVMTQRAESRRLAEAEAGRMLTDAEISRHWFARGRAALAGDPAWAATLFGRKALLALSSAEQPLEYSPRCDANPLRHVLPLPFAALAALAAAGALPSLRRRALQPAALVVAATVAVLLVFYVASRYRLPMLPGLAALGGVGAATLSRRNAPGRGGAIAAAAAVALVSVAWFPLTQGALARRQDAMTFCDIGTAQRELGRLDDAVASFDRAISLDASYPFAHLDLGKTLARAGRDRDAEAATREAIRLAPGLAEAHLDLGVLAYRSGRFADAAAAFAESFRLDPDSADAGNNLAGTYLQLGRRAEARAVIAAMRARGLPVDAPLARATGG